MTCNHERPCRDHREHIAKLTNHITNGPQRALIRANLWNEVDGPLQHGRKAA